MLVTPPFEMMCVPVCTGLDPAMKILKVASPLLIRSRMLTSSPLIVIPWTSGWSLRSNLTVTPTTGSSNATSNVPVLFPGICAPWDELGRVAVTTVDVIVWSTFPFTVVIVPLWPLPLLLMTS
ncbi:MAG: hypothetical protein NTX73_17575 [Rhodobacterales bacterium]|nr:hypothetical protein [Rhodobacterales bacterium]